MSPWIDAPDQERAPKGCRRVMCIAHIRLNATGEVRRHPTTELIDDGEDSPSVFNYEENNYSCDCNRRLFFEYAVGKKYEDIEHECSNGLFSVNLENPATKEIYYREFETS